MPRAAPTIRTVANNSRAPIQRSAQPDGGGGGEKPRLRCLNVTRYVVAAVMTVLIVCVTFNTVKLLIVYRRFHHDPLDLSVVRGTVYVRRAPATNYSAAALIFYIGLRVSSARGIRYYLANSTAYLFEGNSPSSKDLERAAVIFSPDYNNYDNDEGREAVQQEGQYYILLEMRGTRYTMMNSYFDALYGGDGRGLNILTSMRLEGMFITEIRSVQNTTYLMITYYDCWPIIVTEDSNEAARYNDVRCIQGPVLY